MRAFLATYLFSTVGLWSVLFHADQSVYVLPHALFYATLTINTYFSVRFYSAFTPASLFQTGIDLLLAVSYVALAVSIGNPVAFPFAAFTVFVLAPVKYAHMLGRTAYDKTLRKKILIDLLGTVFCAFVLGLSLIQDPHAAAWILAVVFIGANVYLLAINPMYRHASTDR